MNPPLDPRVNPYRPDLAAAHLEGRVAAARFVTGTPHQVRVGCARLTGAPDDAAPQASQALFGEVFTVYEWRGDWAWGQLASDGYVGWLRREALAPDPVAPTHRVAVLRSFLFPVPDLKAPPRDALSLGAAVRVVDEAGGFAAVVGGGWIYARHLAPAEAVDPDPVATARRFLGVPYLWGGRTSLGVDCSGLVQIALGRAGLACPRDSDMQARELGVPVDPAAGLQRGDLVFFPGHVGIMADAGHLVHANAFHMMVTEEPLADVVARGATVTVVRRPALPAGPGASGDLPHARRRPEPGVPANP